MTIGVADEIIVFFEEYNKHFENLIGFLREKENRILKDDLDWLNDSLVEEQKYIMIGNNIEKRRLEMFHRLGLGEIKSSELAEKMPEERKRPFLLQCKQMEDSIQEIRRLNDNAENLVKRKLEIQAKNMGMGPTETGAYSDKASKVHRSVGDIIGSV